MKLLLNLSRIILALVFIFSGFVKAVDPLGGAIKIEDYLTAFGLNAFNPLAYTASVLLSLAEFMAGFLLLLGIWRKISSLAVLVFMAVFTILTLYIAIYNPVSDCGCFGDAVKLTNWQTFFKDLALLPLSVWVFLRHKHFGTSLSAWRQGALIVWGAALIGFVTLYAGYFEPIIDFRPYAEGTDIKQGMTIPPDAPQPEYETTFILEKDGVRQEFDVDNYPYNDTTWVFIDSKTIVIREGYHPPIKDFILQSQQGDQMTDYILNTDKPLFLVVAPKLQSMEKGAAERLIALSHHCLQHDYPMFVATSSLQNTIDEFDLREQAGLRYLSGDETMLKTIVRSNPGILILIKGTIVAKYNLNNLPEDEALKNPLSTSITKHRHQMVQMIVLTLIFATLLLIITLYRKP